MLPNHLFFSELIFSQPMNSWHVIINHLRRKEHAVSNTGFVCESVSRSIISLCDTMNCNPSGSSVLGILQARILEWVATPSSRASS